MLPIEMPAPQKVLAFWFGELTPKQHFIKDSTLDDEIRLRFLSLYDELSVGVSGIWQESARNRLAAIIVLDQFARNMFRGDPKSFAADPIALTEAKEMVALGLDRQLTKRERVFCYLPFEHAENMRDQDESVRLFAELDEGNTLQYAQDHHDVIAEFGRFPHRNAVLGRNNTAAEEAYLAKPGAGF